MGNVAKMSGTVIADPEYSHTTVGEKFYKVLIEVARMSGTYDEVPCIVPEIFAQKICRGQRVHFDGEVRTYYSKERHLDVYIFAKKVYEETDMGDYNHVEFDGLIKYPQEPRRTALTNRTIVDFTIVNRDGNDAVNYIPAIAWGRNAYRIANFGAEQKIRITGRFQSRVYKKDSAEHTVYEISVSGIYML